MAIAVTAAMMGLVITASRKISNALAATSTAVPTYPATCTTVPKIVTSVETPFSTGPNTRPMPPKAPAASMRFLTSSGCSFAHAPN